MTESKAGGEGGEWQQSATHRDLLQQPPPPKPLEQPEVERAGPQAPVQGKHTQRGKLNIHWSLGERRGVSRGAAQRTGLRLES